MVQGILKGERAILNELDLERKREERNKLLRFHVQNMVPSSMAARDEENGGVASGMGASKLFKKGAPENDLTKSLLHNKSVISSINEDTEDEIPPAQSLSKKKEVKD
jgi:hypothetical protein